jgi:hypothetical protein
VIRKILAPAILLVAACAPINRLRTPAYETQWPITVRRATLAADSGNYGNAERILAAYATENPRTREAREIVFWRAMFKLDPGNSPSGSLTEGLALLDRYIADTATVAYRSEATILKRLAVTTQVLQAKAMTPPVRDTTVIKTSDGDVAALRAELARTQAELDRIKKRLANPNK